MKVPYIDLGAQHQGIKQEILDRISGLLDSGQFILGDEVKQFEESFATLCNTKYSLGVANGTDALFLSMMAIGLKEGDEVITAPNSYLASASSIALAGAKIRFAEVRDDFNLDPEKIKKAITPNTRAIIAVHLTGRPAPMDEINAIATEHNLHVIEDCAQAVGATLNGRAVGSFGTTGCFSLHPLKNLSACGDGGMITTNDTDVYNYLIKARNHGLKSRDECEFWSYNSRLDNMQAAILNIKLQHLNRWNNRRREIAGRYYEKLNGLEMIIPRDKDGEHAVYHTFIIQTPYRDKLKQYLESKGIETKVHYPIPIYLQSAAHHLPYKKGDFPITDKQTESILSLPVFPELTNEQVDYVTAEIHNFYQNKTN